MTVGRGLPGVHTSQTAGTEGHQSGYFPKQLRTGFVVRGWPRSRNLWGRNRGATDTLNQSEQDLQWIPMRSITIGRSQDSPCALPLSLDAFYCCDTGIASNRVRRLSRSVLEQRRAEVVEGKDQTARPGSIRECIGCRESGCTHVHRAALGLAGDMCKVYGETFRKVGACRTCKVTSVTASLRFI